MKISKSYYFIFSFLILSLASFAQYDAVGTTWYYGIKPTNGDPTVEGVYTYKIVADTTIENSIYSKLNYKLRNEEERTYLITKDNDGVYYWKNNSKKTLIKWNVSVNDTITIDAFFSTSKPTYKDSVVMVDVMISEITYSKINQLANDSLKTIKYRIIDASVIPFSSSPNGVFTDKVININTDLNSDLLVLTEQYAIPEGGDYLRCYTSASYQFKNKEMPVNQPCDLDRTGMGEVNRYPTIALFPNPVNQYFTVSANSSSIKAVKLYNVTGQLVSEQSTPNAYLNQLTIDVAGLKNGLYLCVVELANGSTSTQKLVKQ